MPSLPCSLRAQFCDEESAHNPLHGSSTPDEAEKEIEFFFPKEKTLAVIKPNAMEEKGNDVHVHWERLCTDPKKEIVFISPETCVEHFQQPSIHM